MWRGVVGKFIKKITLWIEIHTCQKTIRSSQSSEKIKFKFAEVIQSREGREQPSFRSFRMKYKGVAQERDKRIQRLCRQCDSHALTFH